MQNQEEASRRRFGMYKEIVDLEKAIKNLSEEVNDVISYNKINQPLVFSMKKVQILV